MQSLLLPLTPLKLRFQQLFGVLFSSNHLGEFFVAIRSRTPDRPWQLPGGAPRNLDNYSSFSPFQAQQKLHHSFCSLAFIPLTIPALPSNSRPATPKHPSLLRCKSPLLGLVRHKESDWHKWKTKSDHCQLEGPLTPLLLGK